MDPQEGKFTGFLRKSWVLFLLASLTLGLAPFAPEPHIWEKIRWMVAGEFPMEGIYIFDTFLHGAPWLLLLISAVLNFKFYLQAGSTAK